MVVVTPTLLNPNMAANSLVYESPLYLAKAALFPLLVGFPFSVSDSEVELYNLREAGEVQDSFWKSGRRVANAAAVRAIAGSMMDHFTRLMPSQVRSVVRSRDRMYIIRTIVAVLALFEY